MRKLIVAALLVGISTTAVAQTAEPAPLRGWQIAGLPALNFNADEGFGYGVIVQAFNYGATGQKPYAYMFQPVVFLTTKGRRDVSIFFDAPHLLPNKWRMGAYLGREQQFATPYYGLGNNTIYDSTKERAPNVYYYRYERRGIRFSTDLQRPIGGGFRVLVGAGRRTSQIDETPFDSGTTLLRAAGGPLTPNAKTVYVRGGLVYDTRDRETGPTRGQWIELLVQRGGMLLGGDYTFTRATATVRAYVPLTDRLVFAERVTAQNLYGKSLPFYERFTIQGSFKDDEGLGGAGNVRGWPKDRFAGNGMMYANQELRWRAKDFSMFGRSSALVLSTFADVGRVWNQAIDLSSAASDLHVGVGGGLRIRFGQDFVVGVDVAHSKESTAPIYIGLGYLY